MPHNISNTLLKNKALYSQLVLTALNFKEDVSSYIPVINSLVPSFMMTELLKENKSGRWIPADLVRMTALQCVYSCLVWMGTGKPSSGNNGELGKQCI